MMLKERKPFWIKPEIEDWGDRKEKKGVCSHKIELCENALRLGKLFMKPI